MYFEELISTTNNSFLTGLNIFQTPSQSSVRMSYGKHTTLLESRQLDAREATKRESAQHHEYGLVAVTKTAPPYPSGLERMVKRVDALVVEKVDRRRVFAAASGASTTDGGTARKNAGVGL